MIYNKKLEGKKIYLQNLDLKYCQKYYVDWLNDTSINSYIEPRLYHQTIDSVTKYVKQLHDSSDGYIFGIFCKNEHIGNIQLSSIHPIYKYAKIGYIIGNKEFWGKGIATEAVGLIKKFAFETLNLRRLEAWVFEENIASQNVLSKNGFLKEGVFRKRACIRQGDKWSDYYEFGVLNEDYTT